MGRQPDRCPGCGADVHPKAHECPECGSALRPRSGALPMVVAVAGVGVAMLAGVGVWLALSPGAPSASRPQAPSAAAAPSDILASAPGTLSPVAVAPSAPLLPGGPAALQGPPSNDPPLPLPHVQPGIPMPGKDAPTREAYAKSTQDNFVQNGLELKVQATGPQSTVMNIVFNFPAKSAVELISSGPFPNQCRARGFTSIVFTDSTNATWNYDLSTDKLSQK